MALEHLPWWLVVLVLAQVQRANEIIQHVFADQIWGPWFHRNGTSFDPTLSICATLSTIGKLRTQTYDWTYRQSMNNMKHALHHTSMILVDQNESPSSCSTRSFSPKASARCSKLFSATELSVDECDTSRLARRTKCIASRGFRSTASV